MNITIFGMGHVRRVTAACLAEIGHSVTRVDLPKVKVSLTNSGGSPVIEPGLEYLIRQGIQQGHLRAVRKVERLESLAHG